MWCCGKSTKPAVIGRVEIGIVTVRLGHAGLGVVGHGQRRNAVKMFEGVRVAGQPGFHLLIARGLGPGIAAGSQRSHEQRSLPGLAGVAVMDRDGGAGPIHARPRPLTHIERLQRQRLQRGFVHSFPRAGAGAFFFAEGPVVQFVEQFADRLIEFFQRKELAMAQRRHDPALGHLHRAFDLGFIARLAWPRRNNAESAVVRKVVPLQRTQE